MPVVATLKKIHSWGHTHGYLRGRHIIITEDYEMKICDAFLLCSDLTDQHYASSCYYPPEYAVEREVTPDGDLWALGMIIL